MSTDAKNPSDEPTGTVESDPIAELMQAPVIRDGNTPASSIPGLISASVVGVSAAGCPLVKMPDRDEPCEATPVWMEPEPDWAHCAGLQVVVGFENGDTGKALLVGVLGRPAKLKEAPQTGDEAASPQASEDVVKIASEKELVLECGKAKIMLRADGRIAILGGYVISRSSGVNKIKGGSVQIN